MQQTYLLEIFWLIRLGPMAIPFLPNWDYVSMHQIPIVKGACCHDLGPEVLEFDSWGMNDKT